MAFITSIGIAVPKNKFEQGTIAQFMEKLTGDKSEQRKIHAVFRGSAISHRYSVLEDYGRSGEFSFYPNTKGFEPFPSTAKRMMVYQEFACDLSLAAIKNCIPNGQTIGITHVITVSCTGMYAPGLDIDLVHRLHLPTSTERICINFMGCYAAINALKVSDSICKANSEAKVLIVCTELCSIHFQKKFTEDNILANALFADGSAAMLIESGPGPGVSYSLENFHSDIIRTDEQHMAWGIGDLGFEMKLSSYVPQILNNGIRQLINSLVQKANIDLHQINHFAIHPGGKKILETVAAELNLTNDDLAASYRVLREYGNMSSPTVIFVLHEMMKRFSSQNNNERVMAMAFGPGLTIESALLKIQVP
ncbi:MAG TPA: type III polyketide synthase [Cyclobacteriaceae bacterium]|nr:type III polyketide synthase [Cyclobacteriaceae bacterium]